MPLHAAELFLPVCWSVALCSNRRRMAGGSSETCFAKPRVCSMVFTECEPLLSYRFAVPGAKPLMTAGSMTARCREASACRPKTAALSECSADLVPLELAQVTEAQQVSSLGEDFTVFIHIFLGRKLPASRKGWSGCLSTGSVAAILSCSQAGMPCHNNCISVTCPYSCLIRRSRIAACCSAPLRWPALPLPACVCMDC